MSDAATPRGRRPLRVAAVDLGATSGRVMVGRLGPGTIELVEAARFQNGAVRRPDGLHWDVNGLYDHVVAGLAAARELEPEIASVGVDAWAVDYGLVASGELVGEPFHYRDGRASAGVETVHALVPFEELYRRNGLQHLPFTTLYQLATERGLHAAETVLLVPDLLDVAPVRGRGRRADERLDHRPARREVGGVGPGSGRAPGDPAHPAAAPGRPRSRHRQPLGGRRRRRRCRPRRGRGRLARHRLCRRGHAAVVARRRLHLVRDMGPGRRGARGADPDRSRREASFTNERGVDGRVRFLHNVTGLWLLNETVRAWEEADGARIDLAELLAAAADVRG